VIRSDRICEGITQECVYTCSEINSSECVLSVIEPCVLSECVLHLDDIFILKKERLCEYVSEYVSERVSAVKFVVPVL